MRLRVLGPVSVGDGRGDAEVGGRHARAALALLVARFPSEGRREWLEDQIWQGARTSDSALRVLVLRLRRSLADAGLDGLIRTTPNGYVLDLGDGTVDEVVDLHRFEALVDRGIAARAGREHDLAEQVLGEALRLWRGEPYEGVECDALEPSRRRLEDRRLDAVEHLAACLVEQGRHEDAIALVAADADLRPDRERLTALSMVALLQRGRGAEAARAAERLRARLLDDLGVDVGDEVRALERWARDGEASADLATRVLRDALPPRSSSVARSLPGRLQRLVASPLLGRDAELGAAPPPDPGRAGGVTCVAGEAGIGKTRLLGEFAVRAHRAGRHVIHLTCHPAGDDGHEVLAELVRNLLEHGDPGRDLLELADEPLERRTGDLAAEAVIRRARLFDAVQRQFERSDRRPVFVVVDDLQWIGDASLRFILDLVAEGGRTQWAFGWRSTIPLDDRPQMASLVSGPSVTRIDLSPLPHDTIASLAGAVLVPAGMEGAEAEVVARAGGNPLYAWELARYLAAGGDASSAPPDLRRIVRRSIDALGDDALRIARLAALVHPGYPTSTLMRLVVRSDGAAEALDSLQRAGVLGSLAGDRWEFRHPLVEQAIADDLGSTLRSRLHLELGNALLRDEDGVGAAIDVAAAHLVDAGALADPTVRDDAIARALEQLIAAGTFDTAVPLARRWRSIGSSQVSAERVRAAIAAATALLAANDTAAALTLLDGARRDAEVLGVPELRCDAELGRGPLGVTRMTEARVEALAALADEMSPEDSRRRIELLCWAAHHSAAAADASRARALVERAWAIDPAGRGLSMEGLLLGMRFQVNSMADSTPAESEAAYADLVQLHADSPTPALAAMVHLFGFTQALRHAEPDTFRRHVDGLRDTIRHIPRPDLTWWLDATDACLAIATGDSAAADAVARAVSTANRLHVAIGLGASALHYALLAWDNGALPSLRPMLEHDATDTVRWVMYLLATVEDGDLASAAAALAEQEPVRLASLGEGWSPAAAALCSVVHATRDERWAASLWADLAPLRGTALSVHGIAYLGAVDSHLARLAAVLGREDDARALFASGVALDEQMGAVHWVARARRDAAELDLEIDDLTA